MPPAAAERAHCHTNVHNADSLEEDRNVMPHVTVADKGLVGKPTLVPLDAGIRAATGSGPDDGFFVEAYVDDNLQIIVQHDCNELTALDTSASFAPDQLRLVSLVPRWQEGNAHPRPEKEPQLGRRTRNVGLETERA